MKNLDTKKFVIIVLGSLLFSEPFGMLQSRTNRNANYKDRKQPSVL